MPDYYRYAATAAGLLQDIGRAKGMGRYGSAAALAPAISAIPGQIGGFLNRRDDRALQAKQAARQSEFDDLRRRQANQQLSLGQIQLDRAPGDAAYQDQMRSEDLYGRQRSNAIGDMQYQALVDSKKREQAQAITRESLKAAALLGSSTDEAGWDKTKARLKAQGMDMSRVPENRDEAWLQEQALNVLDNAVMGAKIRQQLQPEPYDLGTVDGFVRHIYGANPTPEETREGIKQFNQLKAQAPALGTINRYITDKAGSNPSPERQLELVHDWNDSQKRKGATPVPEHLIPYFSKVAASDVPYNVALKDLSEMLPELMAENPEMDALKTIEALRTVYRQPSGLNPLEMLILQSMGISPPPGSSQDAPSSLPRRGAGLPRRTEGGASGYTTAPDADGNGFVVTLPDGRKFTATTQAQAESFIREMSGGK